MRDQVVDIWSSVDQSGNAEQVSRQNAELERVAERVELHGADMRDLPFEDGSFDVVVSSLAIYNVSGAAERAKALSEAARVLKRTASWRSPTSDTPTGMPASSRLAG